MEPTPEQQEQWELAQIRQRPSRYQASHISRAMRQTLIRHGLAQTQVAQQIEVAWKEAVGAQLAAVTRPGNISRGVLQVFVRDSVALQELHLSRRQILAALQQALPHFKIKDFRGRVSG